MVIDVEFANVTFVETQVRAGRPPHPSMLPALPAILGNGIGGTVAGDGAGIGLGAGPERRTGSGTGTGSGAGTGSGPGAASWPA